MPRALTLALVLLAASALPLVAAASSPPPWSVDETVTPVDTTHATREWKITYDTRVYSSTWPLAVPPDATFVGAHGANGEPLSHTSSGSVVTVTSDGSPFFVDFEEPLAPTGAFLLAPAGPSADNGTQVTVHYALPPGWTLAGWQASPGIGAPDGAGAWHATNAFYLEAALLPTADPGPDARGAAQSVVREANATILADGSSTLDVTMVYDTERFDESWRVPTAPGARLLSVSAPLPNASLEHLDGVDVVHAPYPTGYHLGPRAFTLHYAVDTTSFGGGYRRANFSIAGTQGEALTYHLALADGLTFVGARLDGTAAPLQESYHASGPSVLSVAYWPPAPSGAVRFVEGPFAVQAPAALEAQARLAAQDGAAELPLAAPYVASYAAQAPIHVVYTPENVFGWEEGVYHGLDATSIRASDLQTASGTPNLTATRTLVHEATHDLVDRQRNGVPFEDSFLNEGLSRLAEAHVELRHADQVLSCSTSGTTQRCSRESARVDPAQLRAFLISGQTFDVGWNATTAPSDEQRGFEYDYSGFVLLHYERVAPPGALARALADLANVTLPKQDAVLDALLKEAPGLTRDDVLYPGRADAASLSDADFAAKMGDLVAPPFPTTPGIGIGGVRVPDLGALGSLVAACAAISLLRRRA